MQVHNLINAVSRNYLYKEYFYLLGFITVKYQNFGVFFLGYKKYVLLPVSFLNNNF
jgi:hypothetical protein